MKKLLLGIFIIPAVCFSQSNWNLKGNANANSASSFIGTTDEHGLRIVTNNTNQIVIDSANSIQIGSFLPNGVKGLWFYGQNITKDNNCIGSVIGTKTGSQMAFSQIGYSTKPGFTSTIPSFFLCTNDSSDASCSLKGQVGYYKLAQTATNASGAEVYSRGDTIRVGCKYVGEYEKRNGIQIDTNSINIFTNSSTFKPSLQILKTGQVSYPYGTPASGDVLTSDQKGNASWQPLGSGLNTYTTPNAAQSALGHGRLYILSTTINQASVLLLAITP